MKNKRILSGIQPSGVLHIGNYFGAIKQFLQLQEENECYYFIANYHALNSIQEPELLKQHSFGVALDYLALGLDPEKVALFLQSDVPEVTELAWILSTITSMGLLERAHSYKDKIAKGQLPNHGLFAYPVLMAADILIYDSDIVPVGKDQKQHLEMTRDIAIRFNNLFGETFVVPEPMILSEVAVVPGVDGQKMSKSYDNTIEMFLEHKPLKKKVMGIVTDSKALEEPKDPDHSTIVDLYKLFATKEELQTMRENYLAGGFGYGHAKKELLEKIWAYFEDARNRRKELTENLDFVREVLRTGAEKARERADVVMKRVRAAAGIEKFFVK
ncbi:MAG: tryptophan--tRNA ligase [Deferribacteres bacterium]|nr:tryptophan--tRNA ligase [candidate division KSB1 bacterium]MCB9502251.1 tryptophan--tRNA ligase [Deferribacteres bacterium]